MTLPHPWPAVIVALVATNLVTAAVVVLWSEGRLAEQARWSANRTKAADLFALVTDLGGLSLWLEVALNDTLPPGVRGDAVANATGPATSLGGHARDLADDYRSANATLGTVWSGAEALGFTRRSFPDMAREFYAIGAPSPYHRAALENITRIARGLQGLLYLAAPTFDASAPLAAFAEDPIARLSGATIAALAALASQAMCLHERLSLGEDLGPCLGGVTAP